MTFDDVKKADVVKRIVARCIASKTWRAECETECVGYATDKAEKAMIIGYVQRAYEAAGAGYRGRWQ